MKEICRVVADRMKEYGINYAKGKKRGKIVYPYFVGQLYQVDPGDESGIKEYELLLDGFDRNPDESEMMSAVEKIEEAFPGMEVMCDNLSLGVSCHVGYGALGIGCSCKPRRKL